MKRLVIETAAEFELENILDYIALQGNPQNARRVVERIWKVIQTIPFEPRAGRKRDDLLVGIRQRVVGRYLIFYLEGDEELVILHVIHGMRHLPSIFRLEDLPDID